MIQNIGMEQKAAVADDDFSALLAKLKSEEFYGIVETHFERGRIVRVKRHETLLDEDVKKIIQH
jgi:hypothetical protein